MLGSGDTISVVVCVVSVIFFVIGVAIHSSRTRDAEQTIALANEAWVPKMCDICIEGQVRTDREWGEILVSWRVFIFYIINGI
jgi:uncharacterized membrane protein YhaH (DUF805 family)